MRSWHASGGGTDGCRDICGGASAGIVEGGSYAYCYRCLRDELQGPGRLPSTYLKRSRAVVDEVDLPLPPLQLPEAQKARDACRDQQHPPHSPLLRTRARSTPSTTTMLNRGLPATSVVHRLHFPVPPTCGSAPAAAGLALSARAPAAGHPGAPGPRAAGPPGAGPRSPHARRAMPVPRACPAPAGMALGAARPAAPARELTSWRIHKQAGYIRMAAVTIGMGSGGRRGRGGSGGARCVCAREHRVYLSARLWVGAPHSPSLKAQTVCLACSFAILSFLFFSTQWTIPT